MTAEEDEDLYRNSCGGRSPERVYRYVLPEAAERLTFGAANENMNLLQSSQCAVIVRNPVPSLSVERLRNLNRRSPSGTPKPESTLYLSMAGP